MYCWNLLLLALTSSASVIFQPQNAVDSNETVKSIPIKLNSIFNNRGFGKGPRDANFDTYHSSYPAQNIPPKQFIYNGINFTFPQYRASGNDNALAQGQEVHVPPGHYFSVSMLAAAETGLGAGFVNATYTDGTISNGSQVLVPAWWSWPYPSGGDLIFPYYYSNKSIDYNRSNIFQTVNWLDSSKELRSIILPNVTAGANSGPGGAAISTRLHIFAMSLVEASSTAESPMLDLEIQYARTTKKWFEGTNKTQIVEVLVNNIGSAWVLANNSISVTVQSSGLKTVRPGVIKRLRPGDQAMVEVGVINRAGVAPGMQGSATVIASNANFQVSRDITATMGIGDYLPTYESVYTHESPSWYNDAKFGIFIHYGVYAVPGWGNTGKNEGYAEWYWWDLNQGPSSSTQTYQYHQRTYGPDVVYDDFIANFTASAFSGREWVDLFADAGAQYFVQVSKHHDGYAIFDLPANVTKRTSVALPPHRNILQELFDAAERWQPQLRRATYYSGEFLPEWFHPDYKKYGFGEWPGGNATNPFTNKTLSYAGYVPVDDYITDVIVPEMTTLADMGTEIMWCDIGGPNMTADWAAKWFNSAAAQNRQVVLDARCGLPGDFDTPEYASFGAVQRRKWESNAGMDPFSYGYNRATPMSEYMNASTVVTSLVDIVSKNGNFLLDVGPQANGSILQVEQDHLRAAGGWIKGHAEAVFNTSFWFVAPEEGELRFTTTVDAFYILVLGEPGAVVEVSSPVPWVEGDDVTVVGGLMNGTVVPSQKFGAAGVKLMLDEGVRKADEWCWVFKITY